MQAVAFAMETQARLLEAHWPQMVLKMPQCKEVSSREQEEPLFRGPRVRMGIHWAAEGTVAQRWGLANHLGLCFGQCWQARHQCVWASL